MEKRGPTDWLSVRNMAAEAGLKVDENLLYKLEKESPEQFEIAQRMLSEGRAEYLATEPFFLLLLARTAGFSGTEEEVKALSAQRRVALLEATEMEHFKDSMRHRINKIAFFVVALVLLSYPFFVGFLIWYMFGLPILPPGEFPNDLSSWQEAFISWAGPAAYYCLALGPALVIGLLSWLLINWAAAYIELETLRK